jgi:ferredoxin-NADP reductase
VEFTIKRIGEFTGALRSLQLGDRVYLDGPHGAFTLDRHPAPGYVFLAAGVGVTPFLSMLATLADRGDKRPLLLFVANRSERDVVGVRQIHGVQNRLNLTVVHVVSQPGAAWRGERGRITPQLLDFYLHDTWDRLEFFVCANPRTTKAYRSALRDLGVPASRIHTEQFAEV